MNYWLYRSFYAKRHLVVGWVKRSRSVPQGSETQQMPENVGFCPSTQPTKIKLILFTIRGAIEPNYLLLRTQLILLILSLLGISIIAPARGQSITPSADVTNTLVNQSGNQINITGGTLSSDGANLFHSFQKFGLNQNQIANFLSNPNIQNILGRVVGGDPSVINGLIQITGGNSNLYLMNPAGIVFGSNASLNVPASFTATTATSIGFGNNLLFNVIGTNDYANLIGNPISLNFNINQPGSIINAGNLQLTTGENLTLIGGNVINTGTLTTPQGNITIAAVPGSSLVRISQTGNLLSLEIDPNSATGGINALTLPQLLTGSNANIDTGLTVNNKGGITLTNSGANISSNGGVAVASGNINVSGQTGGTVNILGKKIEVINSNINASGTNGGGTVLIGGDYQGKGTVPNSQTTFIDKNSQINADAVTNGDGGKVVVWSDEKTQFNGNITARGGSQNGNGGFAEVSGKQKLIYTGFADLRAANGQIGNLLLDPDTFTIANTGGDIDPATVAAQWNTANQTYQATTSLTVTDAVSGASDFNLTLDAPTINLNAPITNTGTGQLSGTANTVNVGANGLIQNGVDVAATGGKVNLAAATYTLSQQIDIDKSLTVTGAGANNTTVSGNNAVRAFNISGTGTNVTIDSLTISNGKADNGGGIQIGTNSTLNLNNSNLTANSGFLGGGIYNTGTLKVSNSNFSGNSVQSSGGGIYSDRVSTTVVSDTTFSNNSASTAGGLYSSGTATVSNSTFSGNSAGLFGGGIYNDGTITILNSTFSGNLVTNNGGGGGGFFSGGTATVSNSTFSGNSAPQSRGGGIYNNINSKITLKNSIVAGNTAGSNAEVAIDNGATVTSLGYNLVGQNGDAGGFPTIDSDIVLNGSIDTAITKLGNYGGTTQTHALVVGSPAIDAGDNAGVPATDQRGGQRGGFGGLNAGDRVDIGAFEATSSYLVTNTNDGINPGAGSLRGALSFFNGNINNNPTNSPAATDTIRFDTAGTFATPQTITLTAGELALTRSVNIEGTGASNLFISGNEASRVFNISGRGTNATIDGLTITKGNAGNGYGGGIQVGGSILNLTNSILSNNLALFGGGIYNYNDSSTVTITNSNISSNSASISGGGIYIHDRGTVTISNSNISSNSAKNSGGGIFNFSSLSTVTISNSNISGNLASTGGGIYNKGSVTVSNSIFSDNSTTQANSGTIDNAGTFIINNNSSITGGSRALAVSGSTSSLTLDNVSFSGQTGDYIALSNGALAGQEIDATNVTFDGVKGANPSLSQLFAIEDKITHGLDDPTLGLIRVNANNIYVTPKSGSIQRGLDLASVGNTINIATGTYNEPININQSVNLAFDPVGVTLTDNLTTAAGGTVGLGGKLTVSDINFSDAINLIDNFTLIGNNLNFGGDITATGNSSLTLQASQNITTRNIAIPNGGISLNSLNGAIQTGNLNSNLDLEGDGGDITVQVFGNITTGDISTITNSGKAGAVSVSSTTGTVTAGNVNTNSAFGDGGAVTVNSNDNVNLTSINSQGGSGGKGGDINITAKSNFQATGTFTNQNNINASISSSGGTGSGAITINHGNENFVVGDATVSGTAGTIVSESSNIIAPSRTILGSYSQGNIKINSPFVSTEPITPTPTEPTTPTTISTEPLLSVLDTLIPEYLKEQLRLSESKKLELTIVTPDEQNVSILTQGQAILEIEDRNTQEFTSFLKLSRSSKKTIENMQATLRKLEQITGTKSALIYVSFANQNCLKPSGNVRVVQDSDVLCVGVVTADALPIYQVVEGTNRKQVMSIVGKFRSEITDPDNTRSTRYLSFAQQLYKLIIAPREEALQKQGINNLMFVMDEGLRSLPLAALHDGKQFLVEKYSLALIPSFRLTDTDYQGIKNAEVLAMGAAKFTPEQQQSELRAVPIELATVTKKFKGQFFLNQDFTFDNLKRQRTIKPYPIIHLATHADFPTKGSANNNQPYIQLYNKKLQLDQIEQLGWKNPPVELLVLSACKSAVGDEAAELGFAGLAVKSGVKTAVASLWYVSDPGTFGLMTEFYNQLRNAPVKAEALRQAQIAMIRNQVKLEGNEFVFSNGKIPVSPELAEYLQGYIKGNLSHPYYWAAFNVVGSPW
ncbi:MAG TPA: CHAT domain-containing protein [Nostocaceae cyanobacterium]|nr:CHAT domain-containing protein [Nostocaceae cyanobacterium]